MRSFSTWAGGLKSLISELSRYSDDTTILVVLGKYGCNTIERQLVCLDYLSQAVEKEITKDSFLGEISG